MAMRSEELYQGVEEIIDGLETRPHRSGFIVHDSSDTAKNIASALSYSRAHTEIFWGIKTEIDGNQIPQTLNYKVDVLRENVNQIKNLEEYPYSISDFVHHGPDLELVEKLQKRKIGVELEPDLAKSFRKTPRSALEAYRTPSVREMAHLALLEIGDPMTQIIDVYEQYADDNVEIKPHIMKMGNTALEIAAFATGGQVFVELLGTANRVFYEGELERRNLYR